MANLKIIWTTGKPFSAASIEKIGYQISSGEFNIYIDSYWANQSSYMDKGYRPATAKEIEEHWEVLHPKWNPEPGDKVIITQEHYDWYNKRGVIVEKHDQENYWRVQREDGQATVFNKSTQMILAPYEESVSIKQSISSPKEGYVTVRLFTEEEFRSKGLWSSDGYPKFWNSDRMMNKYLGTYIQVHKSSFNGDNSFGYDNWHFRVDNYEVIYGIVETKEPEMKPQRFKVGDRVTYKSKDECHGYKYGGIDNDGYVGTIRKYGAYNSDENCYLMAVSSREGEYNMLESEFREYDGIYPKVITSATSLVTDVCTVAPGTANIISIPLDTWGVHIHKTSSELKEVDKLAKYDQAPVILQKKPKRKLITVKTY